MLDGDRLTRPFQRCRKQPAFAGFRHRAEQRQRTEHATHRPSAQGRIAGKNCRDRRGGDRTHGEPHTGAGVSEIEHILGLRKTTHTHPTHSPPPLALLGKIGAKISHSASGVEDIFGLEQAGNSGFADRERAQDQGTMRHGLVARCNHTALQRAEIAGNQRLSIFEPGHRPSLHILGLPKPTDAEVKPRKHALTAPLVHGKPTAPKVYMREEPA